MPSSKNICENCFYNPMPWQSCHVFCNYMYPWSKLIKQWKFNQKPSLAKFFAQILKQNEEINNILNKNNLIIPIPMTNKKLSRRGFNQVVELVKYLNPKYKLNDFQILNRIKDNFEQKSLNRTERLKNLNNSFVINNKLVHKIENKDIVLLDDIMTTGTTLYSASQELLKAAKVKSIKVICIARTI